jgi:hypothetical protein
MARAHVSTSSKRSAQRARGVYYTPAAVARYIVDRTLGPLLDAAPEDELPRLAVLDPACGAGAFLTEAYRVLLAARLAWYERLGAERFVTLGKVAHSLEGSGETRLTAAERRQVLLEQVFGVELDPQAAHETRLALANLAIPAEDEAQTSAARGYALDSLLAALEANIRQGDALLSPDARRAEFHSSKRVNRPPAFDWQAAFPQVLREHGGFDAILMNPPYVNIRRLSQTYAEGLKRYLASRYRCARGNYDLYVLFIERAFELLRPGGRCGMITPNKLATLDYAATCRDLLYRETTVHHLADVSGLSVFPEAGVYPHIMVWEKNTPDADHLVRVLRAKSIDALVSEPLAICVSQKDLAKSGHAAASDSFDVESRVPTAELGALARLHSGASGFRAQQLAAELVEFADRKVAEDGYEFIVSGNIDRYQIEPGDMRFMKRNFERPVLPKSAACLTANKHRLYSGSKIVIAGMTRRLEAAFDPGGLALGVQVFAAAEWKLDPRYLLAILNSKLLSFLFRTRFRAKELAGGYLAINKGQLEKLPIRLIDETNLSDVTMHDSIVSHVDMICRLLDQRRREFSPGRREQLRLRIAAADQHIDEIVYRLYDLAATEFEQVEREFQARSRGNTVAA